MTIISTTITSHHPQHTPPSPLQPTSLSPQLTKKTHFPQSPQKDPLNPNYQRNSTPPPTSSPPQHKDIPHQPPSHTSPPSAHSPLTSNTHNPSLAAESQHPRHRAGGLSPAARNAVVQALLPCGRKRRACRGFCGRGIVCRFLMFVSTFSFFLIVGF